jgi:serine/threonine protein kinase/tetratricopeptide (TPR) repeat protein
LRRQIEGLLDMHAQLGSFLEAPAPSLVATVDDPVRERPGTVIGPYKLLEQIGEGGMGLVFVAEQQQPVRRHVALKIIKPGMDSRQVIARFESERQALAMMDHLNIAKVHDGGTTPEGRPYFVMELVKGTPLTDYCDRHRLTTSQRLGLFLDVCQAVQHAHQKGIIHRDLKPSNILVSLHDVTPIVKVIDFGVAKATSGRLTDKTVYTAFAQMVGTPLYMSPEQAGLSNLDVDTRSDVYSLGVLVYELLTGTTPFDSETLKKVDYDEMRRIIREDEPPRPSTRLSTMEQAALSTIAERRGQEPRRLSQQLRGELDWIVMKALEKDRNRRYESVSALAADVQRYLDDEPVQACPPSVGYRLRKFARRHRGPVLASAVVLLALVGGMVGTTWGLVHAERAWQAEAHRAEKERQAKETAQERDAETQAVLHFVENQVFAAARPERFEGGLGHKVTLRRALEAALPFVEKSFREKPLIEARLRTTLGISFLYLGEAQIAAEQFQRARTLWTERLGPDHPETLGSMNNLANSYADLGRHTAALKLREETLGLQKAKLGPDHPDTLTSMHNLAQSYAHLGRHAEARKLREETLGLCKAKLGPDHPDTLQSMNDLANSYADLGRNAEALKLREETLRLRKVRLGPVHLDTLQSMHNLANSYADLGRNAEALKLREAILGLQKAKLGPDHPETLGSKNNLANSYADLGRNAEALKLREETLRLRKVRLGPDHPDTLTSMDNLAESYAHLGRYTDALQLWGETLELRKVKQGPDHPDTLDSKNNLASCYAVLGRHAEARKLHEETLGLRKAKLGPDHPHTLLSMYNLANCFADLGWHAEARKLHEETLGLRKTKLGPAHPHTLNSMNSLANCYAYLGRYADALKLREETLELQKTTLGPAHPDTLNSMNSLASSYAALGWYADALKLNEETLGLRKTTLGPDHPDTLKNMNNLANCYAALSRHAEALKLREETLKLQKTKLGPDHPDTLGSMTNLASSYADLGRHAEARKLREETLGLCKAKLGPDHPHTLQSMNDLAESYSALGRHADARKLHEETLGLRKVQLGPDHPDSLESMHNLANCCADLGRHADALHLRERTLELRKIKLGPDHPDTLQSMKAVAASLVQLQRSAEAVPLIDDCLRRAANKDVPPPLLSSLLDLRLRHFAQRKDAPGCQATARMCDQLKRTDAPSLYDAACMHAVTAAVLRQADPFPHAAKQVEEECELAMTRLKQAVAAGYRNVAHMTKDKDLDALREHEDFRKLRAELEAQNKEPKSGNHSTDKQPPRN